MRIWRVRQTANLAICLTVAILAGLAAAPANTADPAGRDSDSDQFSDGPDLVVEISSRRYVQYGEDKNGNGRFEPEGLDGILGTMDDEFDPNDPCSHPNGPRIEKVAEGLPILKPERSPIPEPVANRYYFFVTMDHEQVVESKKRYSYARGKARLELDTQTHTVHYTLGFCGLKYGAEQAARIMGPASRGAASANMPLLSLPKGLEKAGQWDYAKGKTPSEITEIEQAMKDELLYIDIIAVGFPEGELRGQIEPDRDCDGLTDFQETENFHTDPLDRDSDDDGLFDGEEVLGLARMQCFKRYGWMDYLRISEEIEAGTSDFQVSDLSAVGMKSATISNPNHWDTDRDGLADGLELGVTAPIVEFEQDGIVVQGNQFPDANADGMHDSLGYRLVDLAPDEPNTEPLCDDTNGNGHMDGEDDTNKNGRIDPGEKDPVMGFQSATESDTGGSVDGLLVLGFQADTPYGNCFYLKTTFNFGSMPYAQLKIVEPDESKVHIVPRVLTKGTDGKAPVEFYIPAKQRIQGELSVKVIWISPSPASGPTTAPIPSPAPIPDPEEMAKIIQVSQHTDFSAWVSRNLRGNPPTQNIGNYRGDCDDFCKRGFTDSCG